MSVIYNSSCQHINCKNDNHKVQTYLCLATEQEKVACVLLASLRVQGCTDTITMHTNNNNMTNLHFLQHCQLQYCKTRIFRVPFISRISRP